MRARVVTLVAGAAVVTAGLFIATADISGQAAPPPKRPVAAGAIPRMPDGKASFQGDWTPANFANYGGPYPLQPWAQKVLDERRANLSKDDPEGFCLPAGVPRISPFPQ